MSAQPSKRSKLLSACEAFCISLCVDAFCSDIAVVCKLLAEGFSFISIAYLFQSVQIKRISPAESYHKLADIQSSDRNTLGILTNM